MDVERVVPEVPSGAAGAKRVVGYIPITVGAVWLLAWLFASNGVYIHDLEQLRHNPVFQLFLANFVHGDWSHFSGNMDLWIPVGILLTLVTNNRHVLVIVLVPELLTQVVMIAIGGGGYGFSSSVWAAMAAVLVRATGIAFQNASDELLQTAVAYILILTCTVAFLHVLFVPLSEAGSGFLHFFGFFFGGAIESVYVFEKYGGDDDGPSRSVSNYVGR